MEIASGFRPLMIIPTIPTFLELVQVVFGGQTHFDAETVAEAAE